MDNYKENEDIISYISKVTHCLASQPLDFSEKISQLKFSQPPYLSAAVCIPIYFYAGNFHVQLIKRSSSVSQPGDLSFPGGILSPFKDQILKYLLLSGLFPALRRNPELNLSERDIHTRRLMMLFLANAIREAWEEVRLNPFNVVYLGALPTYDLKIFRRIIFPSVCFIFRKSEYQINDEVESLLHIPLPFFFDPSHYYWLRIVNNGTEEFEQDFPSLRFIDKSGRENILWGATFFLMMRFMEIVYNFKLPAIPPERLMIKKLHPDYHQ